MTGSDWHFKREILAESYFKTVFSGVVLSTTIFAEEKTGLTNFLLYDLIPYARNNNYSVVYIDLSNRNLPATAATLMALDSLLIAGNSQNVSFNFLKGLFFSNKAVESKEYYLNDLDSISIDYFIENLEVHLGLIENKIKSILKKSQLLIVFDHAEKLSDPVIGWHLAACLKTLFLENRERLKPIYATSNLTDWEKVFKNTSSPLNSVGASIHQLPFLDRVFLREILNKEKLNFSIEEMLRCFALIKFQPGIFLALIAGWHAEMNMSLIEYFESNCKIQIDDGFLEINKLEDIDVLHS